MADAVISKPLAQSDAANQVAGIVVKAPPRELEREPMVRNQRSIGTAKRLQRSGRRRGSRRKASSAGHRKSKPLAYWPNRS